jgi:hypothetical protein
VSIDIRALRAAAATLALVGCAACGGSPAPVAAPSPTITAAVIAPGSMQPTAPARPTPSPPANLPTNPPAVAAPTLAPEPSIYLWPTYLPAGMQPSAAESRVSGEAEAGEDGLGFYIITLNGGEGKKLAIGGGGLREGLPLGGDERELVFTIARGKLFVYSFGLSEAELLRVGESLQPIDVRALRELAAPK